MEEDVVNEEVNAPIVDAAAAGEEEVVEEKEEEERPPPRLMITKMVRERSYCLIFEFYFFCYVTPNMITHHTSKPPPFKYQLSTHKQITEQTNTHYTY